MTLLETPILASNSEPPATVLGARVEVGGYRATVRYRGPVPPTAGEWLGVEWDRPGRGKHDGSHNGVNYFSPVATEGSNNCSFLRPEKVDWGVGLMTAVEARYGAVEGDTAGVVAEDMDDLKKEIGARFFQVIGMDKVNARQSQLDQLRTVSVRSMNVRDGGGDDLGALLTSMRELDMAENLISSWEEVARICGQVRMEWISLSENLLPVPDDFHRMIDSFKWLKHLILGDMSYTWSDVLVLAGDLPSLEVLQAHNNKIDQIDEIDNNKLRRITKIDLDGNNISSWTSINRLARLPCLETLHLNGNSIADIRVEEGSFASLTHLQMSYNKVSDWASVGELDKTGITELRMRCNPVCDSVTAETSRQLFIARIGSLKILNGTAIDGDTERKHAEFDYIKAYGEEYLRIKAMEDEVGRKEAAEAFAKDHNRYDKIVEKYGEPEEGETRKEGTTLKSTLIKVVVRCPDMVGTADVVRKLPVTMTVSKLRALLGRLVKKHSGGAELFLSVVNEKDLQHEVKMDNDMRDISFYSVAEGDIIYVRW